MRIPQPRLKGIQELEEEEKLTEKALSAIKRKASQIDDDLDRMREAVDQELERMESERNRLESLMGQLSEDQSLVSQALADLEARENAHKHNLSMLKEEEIVIEQERLDLVQTLKQLQDNKRVVRELVRKNELLLTKNPMRVNFPASESTYNLRRELSKTLPQQYEPMEKRYEPPDNYKWQRQQEPKVKIVNAASPQIIAAQSPINRKEGVQEKEAEVQELREEKNLPPAPEQTIKTGRKSGVLKRLRLAADRYLPEPWRINKPQVSMLEEEVERAESASAVETSATEAAEAAESMENEAPFDGSKATAAETAASNSSREVAPLHEKAPDVDNEISRFEMKISKYAPEEETYEPPAEPFKARVSSIIQKAKSSSKPAEKTAAGIPSRPKMEKSAPPLQKTTEKPVQLQAIPILPLSINKQMIRPEKAPMKKMVAPPISAAISEKAPESSLSENKEIGALSTAQKLDRLHSKLLEMRSALRTLAEKEKPPKSASKGKTKGMPKEKRGVSKSAASKSPKSRKR